MYHGEDLAKANHATLGGVLGGGIREQAGVGNVQAARTTAPQQVTIPGLTDQVIKTTDYARDRLESLIALSDRALDLANRLTGSHPGPASGQDKATSGEKVAPPSAALDVLGSCIGDIRRPLAAMDYPFQRLVFALNAIEEALG